MMSASEMPGSTHDGSLCNAAKDVRQRQAAFQPCIHASLAARAKYAADAVAIVATDREPLTHRRLYEHIAATTCQLNSFGVGRGDRVAIVLPNGPEMALAFLSIAACATAAPLNPAYRDKEFDFYLSDLNAKALVILQGMDSAASSVAKARGIPIIQLSPLLTAHAGLFTLRGERRSPAAKAGHAEPEDVALVLHTSGTTSRPKMVPLTQRNICTSAEHIRQALQLTSADRCLNVMPLFHIHGLMAAILASLTAGAEVVCTPGFHAQKFFEWIETFRPSWYTAVPTMHQAILARAELNRDIVEASGLRFIRSSSSSLPPKVMAELETIFRAPVIEAYGMTEASHQMTSNPLPPGERKPGSVGVPAGPEVAIMDAAGKLLPVGETGEIAIRGANVTRGYENNPKANEAAFTDGWFRTGDQGHFDGDEYLYISGRIKEIINRGGEKISPREVDEVLLTHPSIAQAVTFAMPDARLGEDVAAAVVLKEGADASENEIREFAAETVAHFKVPRRVIVLDEIPKGPTGKLQRIGLAERLGLRGDEAASRNGGAPYVAPRTPVESRLAELWAQLLAVERVGVHDNFFRLGGDSILATQLVSRVRDEFDVELSLVSLFDVNATLARIAGLVVQGGNRPRSAVPVLRSGSGHGDLPLSFAQERLWFLHQYAPDNPVYNRPAAFRLKGSLDVAALERSVAEILRRHQVLRSRFNAVDGKPKQTVAPSGRMGLRIEDIQILPAGEREAEARRRVAHEAYRPFDLARGPLVRSRLFRLTPDDHVLLMAMHHIVFDGWSAGILQEEIVALYHAFSSATSSALPEVPVQYADFARWQRESLRGEALNEHLAYWERKLTGAPLALELPADHPRPAVQAHRGANQTFNIPRKLRERLGELARSSNATLFMVLVAAFKVLLQRYTGQDDIVVGTPIAGRVRPETERLIGCFINILVLRTDLSGDPTFRELLQRVRETAVGAYEHQELPFAKLVEHLQPERSLSRTPLFQVMLQLRNVPRQTAHPDGLQGEPFRFESEISEVDLHLDIVEQDSGLECSVRYDTALFEARTVDRMMGHFRNLLESVAEGGLDRRISELPLLTEGERHQLLVEWNETNADFPRGKVLHQLFEEQVERTPHAVAVIFDDRQLTYRELNQRANRLARDLMERGVGPDGLVGICIERSLEMVVALLAVLKAGGAYVPLDPSYPKERLGFMLEDAGVQVLLTRERLLKDLPEHEAQVICQYGDSESVREGGDENAATGATPDDLAYVIYTSGSTGRPKGVMITHRAIVNHMVWLLRTFPLTGRDSVLQKTPFSFDASVWEFFAPLLAGARLIMSRPDGHRDAAYLIKTIVEHQVTTLQVVPAQLRMLLADPKFDTCTCLKRVFSGGEALPVALQDRFFRRLDAELHNLYGPTETCIHAATWHCRRGDKARTVPIGRPISNCRVYLLDSHLQPVPVGVRGELYVGGVGLARGYLNRPDLTAERFIPHPFSNDPEARLYRTGDLTRYRSDGAIEFLGRLDHQVKIRGFRIELGEIESALDQHPAIQRSVVLAGEDQSGEKRLIAYLVPKKGTALTATELRDWLKPRLPEHMAPSAFVTLGAMPQTPSGKVDRHALPPVTGTRPELATAFTSPRTPVEEALAEIWRQVLGLSQVGVYDNFFELGGHSLLATQVVSRVRDALLVEIPLRALFESPTVSGLAAVIAGIRFGETEPVIPRRPTSGPCPLSFAQQRLWFLAQLAPESPVYNCPNAFRLHGSLDLKALEKTLRTVVERHESLRTTFACLEGRPVQVIHEPVASKLPVIDLSDQPGESREMKARQLIREEARRPFDLAKDPMLRACVIRMADDNHILLITIHHVASDGWSASALCREMSVLYRAFVEGQPSPLAKLSIQYVDFAAWQRRWLQGDVLRKQLLYWKGQLDGAPQTLEFPTDRPRPAVQTDCGARRPLTIPGQLCASLEALCRESEATPFMILIAALSELLHRYAGQEDVLIGTPIANRNRAELEGLIGYFANTIVCRTDLSGNPSFRELLNRVRKFALGAYAHQDLPFERLVEELHPERDISRMPFVQVVLAFQNVPEEPLTLPSVSVEPLEVDNGTAKFDLTFILRRTSEGLGGFLEYNSDLFDAATMDRLLGHLSVLLEGIVADPGQRLSALPLLTGEERHQIITEWNATQTDFPRDRCVHDIFEEQAEGAAEVVAAVCGDESLTYRELNQRANQVAHHLQTLGVGPDIPVGICVKRSLDMVVGLLAILKAGGAYVPLDPTYPKERLAFMLADTEVPVLLTQQELLGRLPQRKAITLCLDADREILSRRSKKNPENHATPDSLAYVIYTSGSTGRPKGVAIPHRAIVRLVVNTDYVRIQPSDVVAQAANASFDAATFELWAPLLNGASLVVVPSDVLLSPRAFAALAEEHGINTLFLTTALFNEYAREMPAVFTRLRHLLFGGEAVDPKWVSQVLKRAPPQRLLHVYGPTETTTFATWYEVKHVPDGARTIPIGRPIANTETYLLDHNLNPVPVGVLGELHVGGPGLAQGYLNSPELTQEQFIPHPFSTDPDARLYKTGDLARYRADGNLEFIGRLDHQVKIHGFRVELGEIEAVLGQHPAVRETAVIAREDQPGDKRLVAYVVCDGWSPSDGEMSAYLREKLPDYMVPSAFITMDAIPLTPSGKLDRTALPAPSRPSPATAVRDDEPRDLLERQLAQVWESILGIQRIGVKDDFFSLGGHSLLAVRLFTEIESLFGKKLPLATLFKAPTVEKLAGILRRRGWSEIRSVLVPIEPSGSRPPFFCVAAMDALCYLYLGRLLDPDVPFYALHPLGIVDLDEPEIDVPTVARQYLDAVRSVQPEGPYFIGGMCSGGVLAFEMAQQLQRAGQKVGLLALVDSPRPCRSRLPPRLRRLGGRFAHHVRALRRAEPGERLNYILTRMQRLGRQFRLRAAPDNADPEVSPITRIYWRPIAEAYRRFLPRYEPTPYPGPITLFLGAETLMGSLRDPRLAWRELAQGGVEVHVVPGDHEAMLREPHVRYLAARLDTCLKKAQAGCVTP